MKIDLNITGLDAVKRALEDTPKKAKYAAVKAMNVSMEWAQTSVRRKMRQAFDRPTPWVLNSLRIKYAKPSALSAELAFKDAWSTSAGDAGGRTMVLPHVDGGARAYKGMEARLMRAGYMPQGYNAVPGAAAKLDAYGNMSRGQITQLLNVLGTYTEAGFNKAGINTVKRLAKGNAKKGVYGFVYWVNRVGDRSASHLQPGVYQRVSTAFGSTLKPVLIFVKQAKYRQRLDFYGISRAEIDKRFAGAFDDALRAEINRTAGAIRA